MQILTRTNASKLKMLLVNGFEYRKILGFMDIEGWLARDEAVALYDVAKSLRAEQPVVVEIGSWLGKSSMVLAKALLAKKSPRLYCIDPFNGDGDAPSKTLFYRQADARVSLKQKFLANMRKYNVEHLIQVLPGYSYDLVNTFAEPIDFLFLDGNHEYAATLRDFEEWSPLLRPGGSIALHDVCATGPFLGPWQVVEQYIFDSADWTEIRLVDKLLVARKNPRSQSVRLHEFAEVTEMAPARDARGSRR